MRIIPPGSVATRPSQGVPAELRAALPTFWKLLQLRGARRVAEAAERYYRAYAGAIVAKIDLEKKLVELDHLEEIVGDHVANIRHGFEQSKKQRQLENMRLERELKEEELRQIEVEERLEAKRRVKRDDGAGDWQGPAAFREIFAKQKEYEEAKRFVEQERERLRQAHGSEESWPQEARHHLETLHSVLAQLYSQSFR